MTCPRAVRGALESLRPDNRDLAVAAVATVVLALITTDVLAGGLLTYVDETVRDAVLPAGDPPTWTRLVGALGNVGVAGALVLISSLVSMQVMWRLWPGVLSAGVLVATAVVVVGLKHVVARPGPAGGDLDGYAGYFPSGHTATAAVCAGLVVLDVLVSLGATVARARRPALRAAALVGVVVAVSTVLGGYHWLSDALASLAVASVVLVLGFGMAEGYVDGRGRRTRPRRHPGVD